MKTEKSKKAGKNSKQLLVFIILLLVVVLGGFYLFSNLDETQETPSVEQNTTQAQEPTKEQDIIPLPPKKEEADQVEDNTPLLSEQKEQEPNQEISTKNLFDESAINKAVEEAKEEAKKREEETTRAKVAEIKQELGFNNNSETKKEKIEKTTEEKNIDFLKNNIKMKVNFFNLNGKNYYEGDEILGYKIKEVTKTSVILNKNGKTTNLTFGSKK
ncbi:TPA: hypothetical protein RQJ13_001704 [Campylobacter fetus subsp. venerealis]|nr:hypothetical protein [Campylobacter fetus subsp. venerealis]HDX6321088.1 hypothetical protein [Campylobacter fetus subsp. venerealis]HDX6323071.1 hypothetical protein [Campylobacter fetus subsp. venerealis]HDX8125959.1 hypothetical protein [Campylobacter fetus subsp. venerealis]HDX8149056.1 hypothetical protein [Campylobacter fetus subsp. venerealis]